MTTYLFLYFLVGVVGFILVNRFCDVDEDDRLADGLMILIAWPACIALIALLFIGIAIDKSALFIRNYKR